RWARLLGAPTHRSRLPSPEAPRAVIRRKGTLGQPPEHGPTLAPTARPWLLLCPDASARDDTCVDGAADPACDGAADLARAADPEGRRCYPAAMDDPGAYIVYLATPAEWARAVVVERSPRQSIRNPM